MIMRHSPFYNIEKLNNNYCRLSPMKNKFQLQFVSFRLEPLFTYMMVHNLKATAEKLKYFRFHKIANPLSNITQ